LVFSSSFRIVSVAMLSTLSLVARYAKMARLESDWHLGLKLEVVPMAGPEGRKYDYGIMTMIKEPGNEENGGWFF
jgi:hypothetical protein